MHETHVSANPDFLSGGGEMGRRIRSFDWGKTTLGQPETWEQSLKTTVNILLNSRHPMFVWWGDSLINIYNDAYVPLLGAKHPHALGEPAEKVWAEIWNQGIGDRVKTVFKGESTYDENLLLITNRKGYDEESYFTFSYSPVHDDAGRKKGLLGLVIEETERVINERTFSTLAQLGEVVFEEKTLDTIFRNVANSLGKNTRDFPFVMVYACHDVIATLAASSGISMKQNIFPEVIDTAHPNSLTKDFCAAFRENRIVISNIVPEEKKLPTGAWKKNPVQFVHLPVTASGEQHPYCIITAALNPYRQFDDNFYGFCQLICDRVSLEVNKVVAFEAEVKRSEALAEIDRSKTIFFSNISHEFRTPLTLMLGPLEDMMQQTEKKSGDNNLASLEVTHRNAMRLLKLVNSLLDFSRIESGRQEATFTPTDIASFTKDLASTFITLMNKGGLNFDIQIDAISQPVYVDRRMWEKIVFNLLSNAFKYTLSGTVKLTLTSQDNQVLLEVSDTGTGIPKNELPKMFDRFHRIEGSKGRTYEGTGIGLSLIRELVQLHGGTIEVQSKEGKGSKFTVSIPGGKNHLPPSQILETGSDLSDVISNMYVDEVSTLIERPVKSSTTDQPARKDHLAKDTVLVVDDNADMRQYIAALLGKKYQVITATNGLDALHKIQQHPPTLILSDLMMPVMTGTQLVNELKSNPATAHLPVIILSARAGEEARIDGYDLGADDYLAKPFSAKELLSRVKAQIKINKIREQALTTLRNVLVQAPIAIAVIDGPELRFTLANPGYQQLANRTESELVGKTVKEVFPEIEDQGTIDAVNNVFKTGVPLKETEYSLKLDVNGDGNLVQRYFNFTAEPLKNDAGHVTSIMIVAVDVTEQVESRRKIEDSREQARKLKDQLDLSISAGKIGVWNLDVKNNHLQWSKEQCRLYGIKEHEFGQTQEAFWKFVHSTDLKRIKKESEEAQRMQKPDLTHQFRITRADGAERWIESRTLTQFDAEGNPESVTGINLDITREKQASQQLEAKVLLRTTEINKQKDFIETILNSTPDLIGAYDTECRIIAFNKACEDLYNIKREDIIGRFYNEVFPSGVGGQGHLDLLRALNGETIHNAIYHSPLSGRYYENFLSPLKDENGKIYAAVAIAHDITESLQYTELIRQSEEKFNKLFDASPIGLVLSEIPSGRALDANQTLLDLIGYTKEEYLGKTTLDVKVIEPEVRQKLVEQIMTNGFVKNVEVEVITKSGKKIPVLNSIERITIGNTEYFLTAVIDISERKKYEKEIEAKSLELQKMNKELEAFTYISSHDLQEPLRKIQTFAGRIIDKERQNLSDTGKDYFIRMQGAAIRMQTLIQDLLSFSRLATTERKFEITDLHKIVEDVTAEFKDTIESKKATIEIGEMCAVNIIPFQFRQLMHNLIGNALKFSNPEVKPHIQIFARIAAGKELDIEKLIPDKKYCHISVTDNGIGFAKHHSEKIFEVFQKLHGKDQYAGTGIGLAIVKKIMDNHHGFITAQSEPGKGARFDMYFPA